MNQRLSNEKIEYNQQIVAFIDLLGYTDLIKKTDNNPEDAVNLIKFLRRAITKSVNSNLNAKLHKDDVPLKSDPKYKIFSDCICISSDCIDEESEFVAGYVFLFLISLMYIQAELILSDIFVRGGVTVNYHFQSEDIIFSSALVDSYRMESKDAIYPRVLIDKSVVSLLRQSDSEDNYPILNSLIKRDADGLVFLDYLEYVKEADEFADEFGYLLKHKTIVEGHLQEDLPAIVMEKYLWVARYHNQKIMELFKDEYHELMIDPRLLNYKMDIFTPVSYLFFFSSRSENINLGLVSINANQYYQAREIFSKYAKKKSKDYQIINYYGKYFEQKTKKEIKEELSKTIREKVDKYIFL